MKHNNQTTFLTILAASAGALVVADIVATGNQAVPLSIRLKNRVAGVIDATDEMSELTRRLFRLQNPASAVLPLMEGSVGWQVELVQRFLNRMCHTHLVEDGWWGRKTENAIHRYYTNAGGYVTPLWNKYFQFVGINYRVNAQQFESMMTQCGEMLK